jgi:hypothetical protein
MKLMKATRIPQQGEGDMLTQQPDRIGARKTLGHLAMHYRTREDGPVAAKLLDLLGFARVPSPEGYPYYHYVVDGAASNNGDGILFIVEQPQALRELTRVIREALKVDQPGEHAVIAKVRAAQNSDPEYDLHLGVLFNSLEEIEERIIRIRDAALNDPDLRGRVKIILNRARPGTAEVDERMDKSPIFSGVERFTYGRNGIQAFVETDLFVTGTLGDKFVFELDYVFPGYPDNILTNPAGVSLEPNGAMATSSV